MANNFQIARKKAGYTGQQIADKLNITRNALSYYETGKREASYDTLLTLSKLYGVSIDYLLGNNALEISNGAITTEQAKNMWLDTLPDIERTLILSIQRLSIPLQYQLNGYVMRLLEQ